MDLSTAVLLSAAALGLLAVWVVLVLALLGLATLLWLCLLLLRSGSELGPSKLATTPRYFYLRPGQPPQGPAELTTVRAMLADGRLGSTAWVALAGSNRWRPASDLLDDGA